MPSESTIVFVSYSHADASLVGPVVKLLRANNSFVFQDVDRIRPGKKWRNEIIKALNEAQLVVVFWCSHASKSKEVSNEWKEAIKQEKDLLPLLLDKTPLPPELSKFQWIDFRGTVGMNHGGSFESPTTKLSAPVKSHRFSIVGVAILLAALSSSMLTIHNKNAKPPPPTYLPIDPLPTPPPMADIAYSSSLFLMVSVVIAVIAFLVWLLRWRSKPRKVIESASPPSEEIELLIAKKLETEIFRRTRTRRNIEA